MNKMMIIANLLLGGLAAASGYGFVSQPSQPAPNKPLILKIVKKQSQPTTTSTTPKVFPKVQTNRILGPVQSKAAPVAVKNVTQPTKTASNLQVPVAVNFQIIGTIVGDTPGTRFAFVRDANGHQRSCQEGQFVEGVKLKRIHAGYVEVQVASGVQKQYIFFGEHKTRKSNGPSKAAANNAKKGNSSTQGNNNRRSREGRRGRGNREGRRQRWQKRMEEMKKTDPERYKRMQEMRQRWQKLRELREKDPKAYEVERAKMRQQMMEGYKKRMEAIKKTDPEQYKRMQDRMKRMQEGGGRGWGRGRGGRRGGDRGGRGRGGSSGGGEKKKSATSGFHLSSVTLQYD